MADAETAFAAHVAMLPRGDGAIGVSERVGLGLVTVLARAGRVDDARERLRAFALDAADRGGRVAVGDVAAIGVGPGSWLLMKEAAGHDWADAVEAALGDTAAVFDQSCGYAVLRFDGAAARLLQKGADLDLHLAAFPPGSAAVTVIAHIGAILWRIDEQCFEAAVFRSLAASFWHWLTGAAAMAGLSLTRS